MPTDNKADFLSALKQTRLTWLANLYSHDVDASTDDVANAHLFDRMNDFGMEHFLKTFRHLNKLREQRGPLQFQVTDIDHVDSDVTFAHLREIGSDTADFVLRVRFEEDDPCRIRYWASYPPLPPGVSLRPYTSADATSCVALERLCPFESADGTYWTIDRGDHFDDYLQLMAPVDAWVAEFEKEIIGFFSCALRPMRFNDEPCYSVYQHHYRVHPEHRAGSVSLALASHVDARRTFEGLQVVFPYSMIDPNNLHMRNVGFPPVEEVRIARLSLSVDELARHGTESVELQQQSTATICALMEQTHGDRTLFPEMSEEFLTERWSRIAEFGHHNYRGTHDAVVALWLPEELNILKNGDEVVERRLAFVLDYGATQTESLVEVLTTLARELEGTPTTHLCVVCDTRAGEYEQLKNLSEDEALLAVHTLPWITEPLKEKTLYCDGIYV